MLTPEQLARIDELTKKKSLNTEEKEELQTLREQSQAENVKEASTAQSSPDVVEVRKDELDSIMGAFRNLQEEVRALKAQKEPNFGSDGWEEVDPTEDMKRARLRTITTKDGKQKVVVDYKFIGDRRTNLGVELDYQFTVRDIDGQEDIVKMTYDKFVQEENFIYVDVLEMRIKERRQSKGQVRQKYVQDYDTVQTDNFVPLTVVMDGGVAVVEHEVFGKFEIQIDRLNS